MFDANKLWKERAGARMKELGRYLKYIFNGHVVIVLFFLVGTLSYYYQQWLKTIGPDFPAEGIAAIVFSAALTVSPVYTFLREADKVFLLPLEEKLKPYFLRSGFASAGLQSYVLILILAIFMPLFAKTAGMALGRFIPILVILLAVKAWNIAAEWKASFRNGSSWLSPDKAARFFLNAVFCYFLFKGESLIIVVFLGIMLPYLGYFMAEARKRGLKWEAEIAREEKRMMAFYRIANMFTDVPQLKESVKRRRWLDVFLARISFARKNAQLYLLSRTFSRSGDYLGLSVRLAAIGAVGITLVPYVPGQIFIALLFLYLTGFQLMPLAAHHENILWSNIYPTPKAMLEQAFQRLLSIVLGFQAAIFSAVIIFMGKTWLSLAALAACAAFTVFFVKVYSTRKMKS